ncbi:hypothetical protein EZV62_011347 [Acer yangbiense]|uniref:Alpha/beta hydrolase fold-3 domain-containing protein n=1 Tax=Acer yangbiense TaxID=1000413 RepID=A0A5C7I487_9ROSI|nr:hypothetical protein EZV62_011347 [Acer yangbiense]
MDSTDSELALDLSPMMRIYKDGLFEAKIIAVSVDYRLAPENPVPAAYEDSWTTLKWVASHFNGKGSEDWLNRHADFQRVFLSGDSAGANIANRMAIKHGHEEKLEVFVSEKDLFRERGWYYAAKLRESGWSGDLEVTDFNGEDHDFHLIKPTCEKTVAMLKSISFINLEQEKDDYGMEI